MMKKKIIWYYPESGFPTYMAISNYRKQNPSFEHSIASKETWEKLTKNQKKYGLGNYIKKFRECDVPL